MRNLRTETTSATNEICQKYVFYDVNTLPSKNGKNLARV